jgi:light-regulated signal transduction histidine kinase (bacteriophytochrome)
MAISGSFGGPVEIVEESTAELRHENAVAIQPGAYALELSLDWIVLRASENIHHLLHESHVTLIDEPLGRFVHAQALHDLRNLFSRLSGTTGIARAYGIRLTDDPDLVDVAFQLIDGRVILEAVPSAGDFGECLGSVGGLVAGLAETHGQALLDNGARRMRALTGYDRVILTCGDRRAESRRGSFDGSRVVAGLPAIVADIHSRPASLFPRGDEDSSAAEALMRAPDSRAVSELAEQGIRALLRVPFAFEEIAGEFRCDSRTPQEPCFEMHAAAELFAQLFAMQLEIDRLRNA